MSEIEFLLHVRALGVKLWLEGDAVKFSAPRGALTVELKEELKARKEAIRHFLLEAAAMAGEGTRRPFAVLPREAPLPLSFGQERLWFLEQLEPGVAAYVIPSALHLEGPIDPAALARALNEIVQRHEVLRTTFTAIEGKPTLVIHERVEIPLPIEDLSALPPEERELAARRAASAEARVPFDLAAGPVLRARLLRLDPERHVLVTAIHHIATDGWSGNVFARELGVLYDAFAAGKPSPLAELPIQYADFAAFQREALAGGALDRPLAYWKARLAGAPATLDLPTDRPRPPLPSHRGSCRGFDLGPELSEALRELARREGVTLFMLLLAAFDVLLARLSGQSDVVVGTPIAGRSRPETEPLIGFFVNTLVLRATIDRDQTFLALLAQVKETCLGAYAHQEMPFERLVQELSPERDPSVSPLFQVLFSLQNAGREGGAMSGLRRRGMVVDSGSAKFDLTVAMADGPGGLHGVVEYATDLFDAATVDRLAAHFVTLLGAVAEGPTRAVRALPLLREAERHHLLAGGDPLAPAAPVTTSIHALFERQVDRSPLAVAVTCEGRSLTYRELDERSNRLAHALIARGVGRDVLVGLAVHRSIEMMVGILGVLKAGGAYLPLDPDYPRDRLGFMIADSNVGVVISEARVATDLPAHQAEVIRLDADWPRVAEHSARRPAVTTSPDDLAYVIYTSGSTGKPKGAMVTHANVVRLFTATDAWYGFGSGDVWTMFHSYAFDFSVWEIWGALLYGGRLVVVPYWVSRSPEAFYALLGEEGVTVLNQTPSAFRQLMLVDEAAAPERSAALRLRYVIFGGEALDLADLRPWWDRHGDAAPQLVNMYGITETTVHVTYRPVGRADLARPWSSVIGRPIPDLQVYVLDDARELQPVGVPGELYVGGAGVSRGYLHRPELTAERFLLDPFRPSAGARLYRTGDRGRVLASGDIEYLGRIDHQVKIRGFRIELGEIEAVLEEHPGVREATVLAREDTPGDRRLVAYLVSHGDAPRAAELRSFLKEKLPDYMVPAAFVAIAQMPLTENGKVDRRALPAPDAGSAGARERTAPRGPIEEGLAGIFAEVLKIDEVGAHDDFFALGGHSLLAAQIMARIRSAFAIDLPLRALFEAPSVAELGAQVSAALREGRGVSAPPVTRAARGAPLPLSFGQERLWFLAELEPGDPSYVVPLSMHLEGALDVDALARALREVVRRHEVLRTTFAVVAGQPVQVIHDVIEIDLPVTSLTTLPASEREGAIRRELALEVTRPFDLAAGPLLRARLFELADADHVLSLSLHHIVSDAWSLGILNREVSAAYRAFAAGAPTELPALAIQYADYAAWQRAWLAGDALDAQLAYWRRRLRGAPASIDLPTDRPHPPTPSHRGQQRSLIVPADVTAAIEELARKQGATLFMTLLAAFGVLLHRRAGQDDIVVGTPIAGRTHAETEGLIGFFVNTLVLRAEIDPAQSFVALLARVKETCLGAYAHQDTPFERLVQALAPERDLRRSPLFQVAFVFQNVAAGALELGGVRRRGLAVESATAKFELTLAMARTAGGTLAASLEYATDLFDAPTIDRMLAELGVLLAGIATDAQRRVADLPLMPEADRRLLLDVWCGGRRPYPRDEPISAIFEAQVDATPDAVAVVFGDSSLTYRELDRRANQLAHALRARGVGPGVKVGLHARRSLELVIATLAILKAGGAYVPLDPENPPQRLAFTCADAGLRVVVTAGAAPEPASFERDGLVCVAADAGAIAAESDARIASGTTGESLAYVMYTSGSTGVPKGVLVPHRGVVRLVKGNDYTRFAADEVFLQLAPTAFDAATFEIWGPLLNGGKLVVFPGDRPSLDDLGGVIQRHGVTTLWLTAGLFNAMVDSHLDGLRPLRRVLAGGDALSAPHVARALAELPHVTIINGYGPTEGTTFTTCHTVTTADPAGTIPIGRPIANTTVYVLDAHQGLAPIGAAGELYIGGDGVALGYLDRPELTAERFVPDPFGSGGQLYRTGDVVRFLEGGVLSFVGRRDFQVKIRGFRIELGEIEAVLAQHPRVRAVSVLAREDTPGDKRLVAYLATGDGEAPLPADLKAFLKERLPEPMVPSAFVALAALPLTENGKVDRRALPAPDAAAFEVRGYVAPRGPIEEAIASIFADLLRTPEVGAHDGFFDLGGHSLLATQAIGRIRAALGAELPLRALFEAPTPAELALRIEAALGAEGSSAAPPLVAIGGDGPFPLSFAEERLWFLDQLRPNDASYLVPLPIHLAGALDPDALRRAVAEVVRRHPILRTTFRVVDEHPAAVIGAPSDFTVPTTSLTMLPEVERVAAAQAEIAVESRRPFDLARGPLFRARLLVLGEHDHVLLLGMHHIVTDGWSLGVLDREITTLYAAFSRSEPSPLPELSIQYTDYAAWQRAWLSGDVLARQLAYWKAQLEGIPRALDLPTDRPRPPLQTYRGARHGFSLPAPLAADLRELARREGATLFMTLLAAFDVLLNRYTGQDDLVVGTPIANRTRSETEALIGFFVNTVALRTRVEDDVSFRDLLRAVRETSLGAYAHQEMPFERLVQELEPERDLSRSPIFQVMFVLQNTPRSEAAPGFVKRRELGTAAVTAKFDLTLTMMDGPHGLVGSFEYATDLFEASTIERMASLFATLLEGVARDPSRPVGELPILSDEARRAIVDGFNATRRDYPKDALLPDLFEAQAARTPDAIALVFEDTSLTYGELDRRSNQLAHALRRRGVGPEVMVGVCLDRSVELVVALYGVLKAGGAYVPLDPAYPKDRLAFMLEDTKVPVLLTQAHLAAALPEHGASALRLDTEWSEVAREPDSRLDRGALGLSSLAYVIYTSGSTGRPKGAMNEHGAILNRLQWMQDAHRLTADDRVLQKTPFSFDVSVWELFWPLLFGARLVVARPDGHRDPAYLARIIGAQGITTLHFVPSMLTAFLDELDRGAARAHVGSLRRVFASGEALLPALADAFFARLPGVELHNLYGPTEAAVDVTAWACAPGSPLVPIGKPIHNVRIYVLDARGQPVPIGVRGELYIGGVQVARGYLNRAELTGDRFVPDPFVPEEGHRLYRTGDVARWLPGGEIEYLGRVDHQVKIRGFRIELGEIEAALAEDPRVREVVVVAREDTPGDPRIVAYIAPAAGEAPPVSELRSALAARLPEYMVPSSFVALAALPLTASGKVDRRALPAPATGVAEARERTAPRGPIEEGLARIFAEVLRVAEVGAHDGFFELGGHSLLATQAIGRIRGAFGVDLPLRALFEAPTPAALAARVGSALGADRGAPPPPLVAIPAAEATVLSFGQERLWFLDQLAPGDPSYIVPQALRFEGALDGEALARALTEVVRRHEVLRTTFNVVDGRPVPVVRDVVPLSLDPLHLEGLPPDERAEALRREAAAEARRPFDLARGPLLRARLIRLAGDDHVLLLTMHHIVSDAWSLGVVNRELSALYAAFIEGRPSPLPELPLQFAAFAAWQRRWLEGDALDLQLAHWKARLAGAPRALELPTDRPRPPLQTHRGRTLAFTVAKDVGDALAALARKEGATLFMTLLAAFDVLLLRLTGQSDLVVGTPIAGRGRVETEGLVGFFLNTLALRTELSPDLSFQELLVRVKESCLAAYAHQDLPFERLVQEVAPERDLTRSPLFQVMFVLQHAAPGRLALPGLKLRGAPIESGTAKFDLTLGLHEREDGGLAGTFEYATDLFDAATIERFVGYFGLLLEGIVRDPSMALWQLPLLPALERQRLVVDWNRTEADFPRESTVHALFEAQARRTPDAVAVAVGAEELSYRALDERANQLAWYLRRLGVGPEVLVGICARRSLGLVVAILGVLKAGGAYVPMDPEYPRDRLAFMVEDAGAPVILTEASLVAALPSCAAEVVRIDADWARIAAEPTSPPESGAGPESLVYVMYTSGSTGKPKGAMLVHRGVVNYVTWAIEAYRVADGEGAPLHSSIAFDLTVTSLLPPLLTGKRVTLVPEGQGIEALAMALRALENQSLVKITPAHLEVLSQQLTPEEAANRTRSFVIGGEALMGKSLTFFQTHAPATRLINEYGPTETVVGCCVHEAAAGEAVAGAVPIGRPIANTQLYVLDPHLQPVPTGVVGEVYIGGVQVGRGYLNQPELTAQRFVHDPFGPPGGRLYRTGDLARHLPDGTLEYRGRIDHQVKIRGYRIELGEIEAALALHPAVREAAVIAREDVPGQKRLVAYLACEGRVAPTLAELRAFLKDTLPEYMIPAAFVVLDALPLTTNRKVDRGALPAPDHAADAALGEAFVAARTAVEEELTRIWRTVLRRKQVGIHDNFFAIGGDSILSIQVVSRAQQAGLALSPRQIFQHQTIAELAEIAGTSSVVASAPQGPVTGAAPLTPIQRWWASLALADAHHYNQAFLLELPAPLALPALERALGRVIEHHDALRLRLRADEGGLVQIYAAPGDAVPLDVVDLSPVAPPSVAAAIEAAASAAQASLDLDAGPVLRAAYLDLGPGRAHRLLLAIHHLAVDGVSWRILFEDLWSAYAQANEGRAEIRLPPKTTSFKRWSERLVEHAESAALRAEASYWRAQDHRGAPRLPIDHHEGDTLEASARSVLVSLDAEDTEHLLRDVPDVYRTRIDDVLLTALVEALAGWTGERTALVDLEGHGREALFADVDVTRTVGWFTSLFPVVLSIEDAHGPGAALKSVKEQLRAIPERGVGYGLLRWLRRSDAVAVELATKPAAEVLFNYLGQFDQPTGAAAPEPGRDGGAGEAPPASPAAVLARLARESAGPSLSPRAERTHLLEVNASISGGRLHTRFTYSEGRHRRATIEALASAFIERLRAIIAHCLSPEAGGATPSDFEKADLSQDVIDMLAGFDPSAHDDDATDAPG